MYFEPEDDEEELFALRGHLAGTRTPTGCLGFLGLLGSALLLFSGLMLVIDPPSYGPGAGAGVLYLVFALLYAIAPGLLALSAMQRPKTLDDNTAAVRQARLLMVFWWLAAVMTIMVLAFYVFAFFFAFVGYAALL
jgi:hypothetical protein